MPIRRNQRRHRRIPRSIKSKVFRVWRIMTSLNLESHTLQTSGYGGWNITRNYVGEMSRRRTFNPKHFGGTHMNMLNVLYCELKPLCVKANIATRFYINV